MAADEGMELADLRDEVLNLRGAVATMETMLFNLVAKVGNALEHSDRGLATDGAADSGPPGWASADQARSRCHAANLASRLHGHGVSSAQLWLVLDGIFPQGWAHEEAVAKLDSETARTLLLEHYQVGKLTANILSLADGNSFTWEILSESTAAQQATDAGSIHLENRLESEMSRGAVNDFEPQEFIGGVPQRLAEATGSTSTEDLDNWLKRLATDVLAPG